MGERRRGTQMSAIRVLTLSRLLGSGGDAVAQALAERLGWRRLDRDVIDRAARSSGAAEAALADIDELNLLDLRPSAESQRAYRQKVEGIIWQAAREGEAIIVGRGSQAVLRGYAHTLHVKIVAPPELRLWRLMSAQGIDEASALNRLAASDRSRAAYLRKSYGVDWLSPLLYDLIINANTKTLDWVIELILHAIRTKA